MKNKESMNPPLVGISVYDSKPFYMLTTAGYTFEKELGGNKKLLKLDIIHKYNRYMNGCDRSDQLQHSYNTYIRTFKWWKRLFFFFLDIVIINCYILKKIVEQISHLEFRLALIDDIINTYGNVESKKRKTTENCDVKIKRISKNSIPQERLDLGNHYPIVITPHECKVCRLQQKRSMTTIKCSLCDVPICVKKDSTCWLNWHEKIKF